MKRHNFKPNKAILRDAKARLTSEKRGRQEHMDRIIAGIKRRIAFGPSD